MIPTDCSALRALIILGIDDTYGLFRTSCSHNPTKHSHIVGLRPTFMLMFWAGPKVIYPPLSKLRWVKTLEPWYHLFLLIILVLYAPVAISMYLTNRETLFSSFKLSQSMLAKVSMSSGISTFLGSPQKLGRGLPSCI